MDGGQHKYIEEHDYEIIWKIIESENLKFYITDLAIQKAHFCCRLQGGSDWANKFITKMKSDNKICFLEDHHLTDTRLAPGYYDLLFENKIELICLEAWELDGIVTHDPTAFKGASINIVKPCDIRYDASVALKLWYEHTLEGKRNFTGYDMQDETLVGLDLEKSNLSKINAAGAEFISANLSHCRMGKADLSQAWLMDANLTKSNLQKANLQGADLSGAICVKTDFSNANVNGAKFGNANLEGAKGALVDWTGVDLSDTDTSALDLAGADLDEFSVRNISSTNELQHVHELISYKSPSPTLDLATLKKWWAAYPNGIKALFFQKQIIAGAVMHWPLTEDAALTLQEQVNEGEFTESKLEICSAQELRRLQGTSFWYTAGVHLNWSLRNTASLQITYLSLLLREALRIWLINEGKYIPKDQAVEVFSFFPSRNNPSHRFGFNAQPGQGESYKQFHKLQLDYDELKFLLQMFSKSEKKAHSKSGR
jgi:hypothetical protein